MSKNIYTIINECVTNLKKTCNISSVSVSGTTYTFLTTNLNGIITGLYVNFGTAKNYLVTSHLYNVKFTVVSDEDLSTKTSVSIACEFLKGSSKEIADIVSEKAGSNDYKYKLYPLIALIRDNINITKPAYTQVDNIDVWLFVPSLKSDRTDSRIANKLILTLEPYFNLFKTELQRHKSIIETKVSLDSKIKQENVFDIEKLNENCDSIEIQINNLNID